MSINMNWLNCQTAKSQSNVIASHSDGDPICYVTPNCLFWTLLHWSVFIGSTVASVLPVGPNGVLLRGRPQLRYPPQPTKQPTKQPTYRPTDRTTERPTDHPLFRSLGGPSQSIDWILYQRHVKRMKRDGAALIAFAVTARSTLIESNPQLAVIQSRFRRHVAQTRVPKQGVDQLEFGVLAVWLLQSCY